MKGPLEPRPVRRLEGPTRLALKVERAYRECRDEAPDAPWDKPAIFDSMYTLASTRGVPVEY